jgi:NNP family nitrate/nitrite transporter-like MFS transporter
MDHQVVWLTTVGIVLLVVDRSIGSFVNRMFIAKTGSQLQWSLRPFIHSHQVFEGLTSHYLIHSFQTYYFLNLELFFPLLQQEWRKYSVYHIDTDPNQDDKATTIKLCSFARPHMRAFHVNWFSFFMAFFIWFAISPLLSEIRDDLGLSKQQIWTSSIIGVGGTIFMRFLLGPLVDKYGPRIPMAGVLCFASIPCGLIGLINDATSLYIIRLFIGVAGGTFVMCQFWSSRMFCREVVGTANAVTAGWGNLGGGVTQLVMGSALFPLFKLFYDGDSTKAWRTVCVVPAFVGFSTGICCYLFSDDCPHGNYGEMKKHGIMAEVSAANSFRAGALNLNTWIMFIQYAICFGVELTMNNAAALYFKDQFDLSTESAAAIASIFGWMNLFARGLGG